jgi:hypothetical protein
MDIFKMSNFDFSGLDLKKTLHSSLRRPLAPFSLGYLYGLETSTRCSVNDCIMQWMSDSNTKVQKMGRKLGMLFCGILGWLIFGDVFKLANFIILNIYKHI